MNPSLLGRCFTFALCGLIVAGCGDDDADARDDGGLADIDLGPPDPDEDAGMVDPMDAAVTDDDAGSSGEDAGPTTVSFCEESDVLATGSEGVYLEVEAIDPVDGWTEESAVSGYQGDAYFQWEDRRAGRPDDDVVLSYCFRLDTPGTYLLEVRGRRDQDAGTECEGAANDECNDVWVQIDGSGHEDQSWTKKMIKPPWGEWQWNDRWDPMNGSPFQTQLELDAGRHVLAIDGRSHRVKIDAIRIYRMGTEPPAP